MITCYFENNKKTSLRHITVTAVVIKDQRILLTKRAPSLLEGGKWCLPGGYLDRDETMVEGVLRELLEETGYRGKVLSLFHIVDNPDRPREDRQNVNVTFVVEPLDQISTMDSEQTEIQWFDLSQLPPEGEVAFDHADTIELYKSTQTKHTPLPIYPSL